jgi:hypothetical protein
MVINRRFTLLNPPEEVRKAEFNRARAGIAQTIHFYPGDPTSPEGYDRTGLPGQNTHAFQAEIFAQRLLFLPPQACPVAPSDGTGVAEAKVCVRQRQSSERSERAVNKNTLKLLSIQRRVADYGI